MQMRLALSVALSVALLALALALADQCPDGGQCQEGGTCCHTPTHGYECCPMHQAECCGDHVHCCPEGTICQVNEARCVNATVSLPWVERHPAKPSGLSKSFRMIWAHPGEEDENVCPDGSHCPAEFSCLEALRGYGCCPLAQGVPCVDGKHCCPEGHQCSADGRSCLEQRAQLVSSVMCSDQMTECPDDTTCCANPDGTWGCCPGLKAVCCADNIHCCPEGTTCDIQQAKCLSSDTLDTPMWAKSPGRARAPWENQKGMYVPCNESVACADGTTCCKTQSGGWACCPMVEAVCCSDFIHCCPKGTTCDVAGGTCNDPLGPGSVRWVEKTPSMPREVEQPAGNVTCDSTHSCPEQNTCCKTATGGWACCPLPQAVCCSDFIHCCPKGTTCDVAGGTCNDPLGPGSVRWVENTPSMPREVEQPAGNVTCDSTHSCPEQTTCCKTATGGWTCCPLPQAVCCDDHEHCCPQFTTCDLASLTCNGAWGAVPMVRKVGALTTPSPTTPAEEEEEEEEEEEAEEERVQCDPHTSCPKLTTCCMMSSGQGWGCCPLPEAICCSDGDHCCPTDYKCNEGSTSCSRGAVVIPWYNKLPAEAQHTGPASSSVRCDANNSCPEGATCCQLSTGRWGCCPLKEAVCCPDQEHCCPQGYSCNVPSGSCQKLIWLQIQTLPMTRVSLPEPQPKAQTQPQPLPQTLPQTLSQTLPQTLTQPQPLPQTQPQTQPQTLPQTQPQTQPQTLPQPQTQPQILPQPTTPQGKGIYCAESYRCRDGETCCKTTTTWSCCPLPNAVCCADMEHCCASGYTCGEEGSCTQSLGLSWDDWRMVFTNRKRAL